MRFDRELVAGLDDGRRDRVVAAAGAQRRNLAFVIAMRIAETVLGQTRMMKFGFCNVGHDFTFGPAVMAGLVPAIHVLARKRKDSDARHEAGHDEGEVRPEVMTSPCAAESA